jgi:hypothetical protein
MRPGCDRAAGLALAAHLAAAALAGPAVTRAGAETRIFPNGFPADRNFFPIGVWLQQPENAAAFKAMGVNTFVGLWHPPTPERLALLEAHGLYLVVAPTPEALALKASPVIRGWMHIDEPDNAQADGRGGYGDCVLPEALVQRYREMRAQDPTRPIYLGFGQGVANPYWTGRGPRCGAIAPQQYYGAASRAADIVAFDIYPVAEARQPHVMGRLQLVGQGVRNLKRWAPPGTPVWADIETTHINNSVRRPTPKEVASEVWMAIINGATGIDYFVHEWRPSFREDGVFRYPDVVEEIRRLNAQIQDLAPFLNGPTIENEVTVDARAEIARMVKREGGTTYIFAANMEKRPTRARVAVGSAAPARAVVVGENRSVNLVDGAFEDRFGEYEVHIYRLRSE